MAHRLTLDVFETAQAPSGPMLMMPEDLETLRLAAYEEGYKAGWDDGCRQRLSDADQAREHLATQLESLNFGFVEAQTSVLKTLRPVFEAVVGVFLPAASRAAIAPLVAETLLKHATTAVDRPLTLRIAPSQVAAVRTALDGLATPPFDLVADPEIADSMARLEAGAQDVAIDLQDACTRIEQALLDLYQPLAPEVHHA